MKYTKSQLIKAQIKYNKSEVKDPDYFNDITLTKTGAEKRIQHLLFLANPENKEFWWEFDLTKPGFYWFMFWTVCGLIGFGIITIKIFKWIFG